MADAAVPAFLRKQDLTTASPGLRFGLLYRGWVGRSWEKVNDGSAIRSVCKLAPGDAQLLHALRLRQREALRGTRPERETLVVHGVSTSPFVTGLGNEHPSENGFSFLNPYGLPYLPGSGVKGVLRQAARELAGLTRYEWTDSSLWNEAAIDVLFGHEAEHESGHRRGVLSFWDVLPEIAGGTLRVDVMTPHTNHYYQNGEPPHDSGTPVPIRFLTIPQASRFTFHVLCDERRLAEADGALSQNQLWKALLAEAFAHAFAWLGFGAKTSVGYGAMGTDHKAAEEALLEAKREEEGRAQAEREEEQSRQRAEARSIRTPAENAIDDYLETKKDPSLEGWIFLLQGIEGADPSLMAHKQEVMLFVKRLMQESKRWREEPGSKSKQKDHERTKLVMRLLSEL